VNRRAALVLGALLAFWIADLVLLQTSSGGVFLASTPVMPTNDSAPQPDQLPDCVHARVVDGRGGPGYQLTRYAVSVTGCNNAAGQLRLSGAPSCTAWSALGPGTASCSVSAAGSRLKVVVNVTFPYGLSTLTNQPLTTTFFLSPSGSYSAL
jgi:hypothetical protein